MKSLPDDYVLVYHYLPTKEWQVMIGTPDGANLVTTRGKLKAALRIARRRAWRHARRNKS